MTAKGVVLCVFAITSTGACSWLDITAPSTGRLYIENGTEQMLTFRISGIGYPQLRPGEVQKFDLPEGEYTIETPVTEDQVVRIERGRARLVMFVEGGA